MPTTIPYRPNLALANVVPEDVLDILKQLDDAERPAAVAEEALNDLKDPLICSSERWIAQLSA